LHIVFIYTCTNLSFRKTFPESLKKFKKEAKEDILSNGIKVPEKFKEIWTILKMMIPLLIHFWSLSGMTIHSQLETFVFLTIFWSAIRGFNGLQPIQSNRSTNLGLLNVPVSDSIFSISDTPTSNKQQISEDIISELRRLYYQRNVCIIGKSVRSTSHKKGFLWSKGI
jgi:hypothetical protein